MDDLLDSVVGSISAWITLQSRSSSSRGPGDSEIYSSGYVFVFGPISSWFVGPDVFWFFWNRIVMFKI